MFYPVLQCRKVLWRIMQLLLSFRQVIDDANRLHLKFTTRHKQRKIAYIIFYYYFGIRCLDYAPETVQLVLFYEHSHSFR